MLQTQRELEAMRIPEDALKMPWMRNAMEKMSALLATIGIGMDGSRRINANGRLILSAGKGGTIEMGTEQDPLGESKMYGGLKVSFVKIPGRLRTEAVSETSTKIVGNADQAADIQWILPPRAGVRGEVLTAVGENVLDWRPGASSLTALGPAMLPFISDDCSVAGVDLLDSDTYVQAVQSGNITKYFMRVRSSAIDLSLTQGKLSLDKIASSYDGMLVCENNLVVTKRFTWSTLPGLQAKINEMDTATNTVGEAQKKTQKQVDVLAAKTYSMKDLIDTNFEKSPKEGDVLQFISGKWCPREGIVGLGVGSPIGAKKFLLGNPGRTNPPTNDPDYGNAILTDFDAAVYRAKLATTIGMSNWPPSVGDTMGTVIAKIIYAIDALNEAHQ